ncbi:hypothetical protein EU92_1939 [Prochlorococcus marinus str. MIT 9107]|uniref:Uncharacterized protein n=1 Tax=Prochlorococcus marinus str. MIT 9116 TaxID=167544 RepID=A0A0A1ZNH3_PROMR|nr:hypothetical protein EU92_1939 [Prochlorococcus marinus str. MIT 9107]KGF91127.1 hypothetical protein EU93_1297 [Prochlorococcus marinus str. MIT 9116]KGF94432.1 hypothetical protein EU94_0581 [Prochlorococcus marinus str. MIT 9123]
MAQNWSIYLSEIKNVLKITKNDILYFNDYLPSYHLKVEYTK